jgi:ABC transporter substrate binding protein
VKRRTFIALLGAGAAAWPLAARAQQGERMRRIGVLMAHPKSDPEFQTYLAAFQGELQKLGWVEGRNIQIDSRWGALDDAEARQRSGKELLALRPDVILTQNTPPTASMLEQTRTITVFVVVADPVGSGFVESLARPAGNATGFTIMEPTIAASGWSCSRRLRRTSTGSRSCSIRPRRHIATFISIHSKPPPRPSHWTRLPHLFTTRLSSNPFLPQRHGSRMVV